MTTESRFYYPATYHDDSSSSPIVIPAVRALPLPKEAQDRAVILEESVGSAGQGVYVLQDDRWLFAMPMLSLSEALVHGDALDIYHLTTTSPTIAASAIVFKNGQLFTGSAIAPTASTIYLVRTPVVAGGGSSGGLANLNNAGTGVPVVQSISGDTAVLRSILAGTNITVTSNGLGSILIACTVAPPQPATNTVAGLVKVGAGLNVAADGTVSAINGGTVSLTGDATGNSVNGVITATLANSGVTAGTYTKVTVDVKGRVTGGSNPSTLAGYNITDAMPLGGGSMAGNIVMTGGKTIQGVPDPFNANDAANKNYVDNKYGSAVNGVSWKAAVEAASTGADVTLSGTPVLDDYQTVVGDRVLIKDNANATQNGIYDVSAGAWSRSQDVDNAPELLNLAVFVLNGTKNGLTQWANSNKSAITIGTTNVTFAQLQGAGIAYTATGGLVLTGTAFSIADTGVAAGSYTKVTVNSKGQVTSASNMNAADISTILGYTPYNGATNPQGFLTSATVGATTLTGDVTGSGTGTFATTLATTGVTAGSYTKVTVDAKGRVTGGTSLASLDVTNALGYTPYDGTTNPNGFISNSTPININGDATGSGTTNITLALAASGVTAGTYAKVTVDAKGRVTAGLAMNAADITSALTFTPVNKAGDTLTGALNFKAEGSISGSATTDLGSLATSNWVNVLGGVATINSFGNGANGMVRTLRFLQAYTLTNSANMVLPGGANIVTASGDVMQVSSKGGGVWVCDYYTKANGQSVVGSGGSPFSSTQEFDGSASQVALKMKNAVEMVNLVAAAPAIVQALYGASGTVQYFTVNAANNWTFNLAYSASTPLNTALAIGDSMTFAALVTNGVSAYYTAALQVDGVATTVKWQGGSAPAAGNSNSIDAYTFTVIKTAAATFTVIGNAVTSK